MSLKTWLWSFCLLLLLAPAARAAQDDELQAFFAKLTSLQADFSQQVFGPNKQLTQEASGRVIIQRPGKFRWDYAQPYQQHIVADGSKVWLYDVDLEQVSVKSQDATMNNTPATLLSDAKPIDSQFEVLAVMREGRDWFELIPKQPDSGFESLFIALDKGVLREMELLDSFGQTTRLRFDNVVINKSHPAAAFKLKIPKGVDVIDETAGE